MTDSRPLAVYQRFLPEGRLRAFVWKYAQSTGGRRPRHFHAEPELNLVVRGSATFGVGDRVVQVSRGDVLAFPAGQDHALLRGSSDLYLYAIGLDPVHSAAVLGAASEPAAAFRVRLATGELERVVDQAAAIVDRPDAEQRGTELWDRIHWLGRQSADDSSDKAHVLTRRSLQLVAAAPDLGLEGLATELRTHPSEVSRHFHRDVGMTFVRYRARQRMLQLIRLVDAGRDLTSAASEAGFGSYSQCHRVFHAELGCAPKSFFYSGRREEMQRIYDG